MKYLLYMYNKGCDTLFQYGVVDVDEPFTLELKDKYEQEHKCKILAFSKFDEPEIIAETGHRKKIKR